MKKALLLALTAMGSSLMGSATAHADCMDSYKLALESSTIGISDAINLGIPGGVAIEMIGGTFTMRLDYIALGVGVGTSLVGTTTVVAQEAKRKDLVKTIRILEQSKLGDGIDLQDASEFIHEEFNVHLGPQELSARLLKLNDQDGILCAQDCVLNYVDVLKRVVDPRSATQLHCY